MELSVNNCFVFWHQLAFAKNNKNFAKKFINKMIIKKICLFPHNFFIERIKLFSKL